MAISNLNLNVTANTARALADFNKFSRSLDNKFLVSGLKLDVVRSALGQINRDFQRAIGEQGLASASSLRAAQNQAALLTQTFKGFSSESALAITQNIGTALNNVAVKAGGTFKDVQKTLAATPFISTMLAEDVRIKISKDILDVQKNFRRAGIGDNFGGIAQQFLTGGMTGMQLLQTGGAMESFLGSEIIKRAGGSGMVYDPKARSELLAEIVSDPDIQKQLREMAKRASGFKIILEDLNTQLFNTESGVFGSLRKVIDKTGKQVTIFEEVEKLVESVFGPKGMFRAIFQSIKEIFKIGDPMRPIIDMLQFVTDISKKLTNYFRGDQFKRILSSVKVIFSKISEVFTGIYNQVSSGGFDSSQITESIRDIGNSIRDYIKKFGETIRGKGISEEEKFIGDIAGTLFQEIGKTAIVLIRELFVTLIDKAPEIASKVLPALNRGINTLLDETFGGFSKVIKPLMATLPGPLGAVARASMITDATGGQGGLGLLGAAAPFLLRGGGGLAGMGGRAFTGTGGGATAFRTLGLGLMGVDPTLALLGGYAPQLLGGAAGSVRRTIGGVGQNLNRFSNSRFAAGLSNYGGSAVNLARNLFTGGMNNLSNYGNNAVNFLGARSNAIQGFIRGQSSKFMAGFRPPFPNVGIGAGTTRAYNLGQFVRNFPTNTSTLVQNTLSSLSSVGRSLGSGISTLGRAVATQSVSALLEIQRATRMFLLGASGSALSTRGRPMVQAGMAFRRFAPGALAGGGVVLGSQLLGNAIGGDAGQQVSGVGAMLGGGISGASTGAMIGSLIAPGVGTAAGAVIGGIIGAIAPLMDKGVRDGVGKFMTGINQGFANTVDWFVKGTQDNWTKTMDNLKSAGTWLMNGMIGVFNNILSGFQIVPKLIMGMIRSAYENVPGLKSVPLLGGAITAGESVANFQLPTMYGGKDYAGPSLALEARMSGRRPMVVNDGEFVIPKDGFSTLAGLVGENLRTTGVSQSAPGSPVQVSLSLTLHVNSVVANPDELASALREPVYKIVGDAWAEAVNATRTPRTRT